MYSAILGVFFEVSGTFLGTGLSTSVIGGVFGVRDFAGLVRISEISVQKFRSWRIGCEFFTQLMDGCSIFAQLGSLLVRFYAHWFRIFRFTIFFAFAVSFSVSHLAFRFSKNTKKEHTRLMEDSESFHRDLELDKESVVKLVRCEFW